MRRLSGVLIVIWLVAGVVLAILFGTRPALLCVQRATVAATLALGWATVLLALLTRQYAEHTGDLVELNKEANENALAAMKAQLRPVLVLRTHRNIIYPYNVGVGPAMNVEVAKSELRQESAAPPRTITEHWPSNLCVEPGEDNHELATFTFYAPGLSVSQVISLASITLVYGDAFGQRFETVLDGGKWIQNGPFAE